MIRAIADTHTVIWYIQPDDRLSATARDVIDMAAAAGEYIGVSAITIVEMVYLTEKGRIAETMLPTFFKALERQRVVLRIIPLDRLVGEVLREVSRTEIPDMPDRIIAATALHLGVPLITKDTLISMSRVPTIW